MRMDTRTGGPLGRWLARGVAVVALAGGLALAPRAVASDGDRLDHMRDDLARVRGLIEARRAEVIERRRRVRALKADRRAVEDIARLELGMVYPGELVIRVEGPR
jgi:hypothetical protein